jgi:hypothetical protein
MTAPRAAGGLRLNDPALWTFVGAMILFHVAKAPPEAYLGLFLKQDLESPARYLAYAFVVSMVAWMVFPVITSTNFC